MCQATLKPFRSAKRKKRTTRDNNSAELKEKATATRNELKTWTAIEARERKATTAEKDHLSNAYTSYINNPFSTWSTPFPFVSQGSKYFIYFRSSSSIYNVCASDHTVLNIHMHRGFTFIDVLHLIFPAFDFPMQLHSAYCCLMLILFDSIHFN